MLNIPDYTTEGFILPIIRDNIKGYASVNAELYRDEDGLDRTGNYLVYLLHPKMGSANFILEPDGDGWEVSGKPFWLTDDIIQEIAQAISLRKNNIQAN